MELKQCEICGKTSLFPCRREKIHNIIKQYERLYGDDLHFAILNGESIKANAFVQASVSNDINTVVDCYKLIILTHFCRFNMRYKWSSGLSLETYSSMLLKSCPDMFQNREAYSILVERYGLTDGLEQGKSYTLERKVV